MSNIWNSNILSRSLNSIPGECIVDMLGLGKIAFVNKNRTVYVIFFIGWAIRFANAFAQY